jgi:tetrahydromethanopterin S-methyltransferase subunit A
VVDQQRDVAICTLTAVRLAHRLQGIPRVAVAKPLATANIGVEQLIRGCLALPRLRHLVVCGRDSVLFRQGQTLLALAANGCGSGGAIPGATGYLAHLGRLRPEMVQAFRSRITVHDLTGHEDAELIGKHVAGLPHGDIADADECFVAGGPALRRVTGAVRRRPIATAGEGYFVVAVDRVSRRIVLRHYTEDLSAGHEITGRTAEKVLLRVLGLDLLHDPAHAGYLGGELAKAETALRMNLVYTQDRPLSAII